MVDVHDVETRRQNMSAIRSGNTRPELLIRHALFARGFRYRLHDKKLPGKPDVVLPKYRAVIRINGCFWHFHGCNLSKLPETRRAWWKEKLEKTKSRDSLVFDALRSQGWRVLTVWECSFRNTGTPPDVAISEIADVLSDWLRSESMELEVPRKNAQ